VSGAFESAMPSRRPSWRPATACSSTTRGNWR